MAYPIWRHVAGVALLALALAGCDSAAPETPQVTGASAGASGVTPTPTPSVTSAPSRTPTSPPAASATSRTPTRSAADVAVSLVRSGGFTGRTETITVKADGSWQHGDGRSVDRTGKLTAAQRTRLQTLAKDPRLAAEGQRAGGGGKCNDTYTYLLKAGSRLIKYEQCPGAGAPPKVTLEIIGLLQDATS